MKNHKSSDEFYIGYAPVPAGYRRFLFRFIPLLLLGVAVFALLLPGLHNQFYMGTLVGWQELVGYLAADPVPHLVVARPGNIGDGVPYSRYLL
ncbi:MAG: hypothetical protein AAGB01_09125, partial [Cyanobacteria bacterium P01_F01_bin.42]